MAGGGGHGGQLQEYTALSHSCSSTTDRSETRKRRSSPHNTEEEERATHEKPYECRFCPMKFSKSQALGGHMNRHRQGRMPGVHNASAPNLSRIHQHHLQRSSSDSCLRHNARMGVAAPGPYATYSQGRPGTYVSAVTSPRASPSWNLGVPSPGTSQSMASVPNTNQLSALDGMLPMLPSGQMVRFPPNNVACIMQQPSAAQVPRHDILQRTLSEKNSMQQLQDWSAPLQVINPMSHRNSEPIVQSEDSLDECIKRSCSDILQDMIPGSNFIEQGSTDGAKAMSESLSLLPETSQQSDAETSNQSHGQSSQAELSKYPSLGRMKTVISSASSSPEITMLSASHLDGLSWGYGTSKSAPVIGFLTSHDLDTELIMKDAPAGAISEGSKPVRWDLGLPNIRNANDETDGSVRDLATISRGASPLHFALDFVGHTGAPNEANK